MKQFRKAAAVLLALAMLLALTACGGSSTSHLAGLMSAKNGSCALDFQAEKNLLYVTSRNTSSEENNTGNGLDFGSALINFRDLDVAARNAYLATGDAFSVSPLLASGKVKVIEIHYPDRPFGQPTRYDVKTSGKPVSQVSDGMQTWDYSYNGKGNLTQVKTKYGDTDYYTMDLVYEGGKLTKITFQTAASYGGEPSKSEIKVTTDSDGRMVKTESKETGTSTYEYNSRGLPVSQTQPGQLKTTSVRTYEYDKDDNLIKVTDEVASPFLQGQTEKTEFTLSKYTTIG